MSELTIQEIKRQFSDALQTIAQLAKERDQLAAKCAALTELARTAYSAIIEHHSYTILREDLIECPFCTTKRGDHILTKLHAAYSEPDQCGAGWLSPEKKKELENLHSHALLRIAKLVSREKVLVEALEAVNCTCEYIHPDGHYDYCAKQRAKQALEAAQ